MGLDEMGVRFLSMFYMVMVVWLQPAQVDVPMCCFVMLNRCLYPKFQISSPGLPLVLCDHIHRKNVEWLLVTASEVAVEVVDRILTATRDSVVAAMAVCS